MLMKKFFKKRWHSIPIGLLAGLLSVCLVAGSVFAYTVWTGAAQVTVNECFTVSNTGNDSGEEFGSSYNWNVSLMPGESKILNVLVLNASSVEITASLSASGASGLSPDWSPTNSDGYGVPADGSKSFTLTITAPEGVTPGGPYTVNLTIGRG